MEDRFRNQHLIVDQEAISSKHFVVIGAGAIGSFYVATLAKMGARKITVYDDDKIENHNISNQLYPIPMIGKDKVDALQQVAASYGEALITTKKMRWHPDTAIDGDIIVSAVDNMDCRKAIWDYYKTRKIELFLEGRMAAQVYRVYGIDPTNAEAIKLYEASLYPQSEALPDRCGEKSIIYTVLQVAGQMLSQTKRFLMREYRPTEVIYDCLNDDVTKKFTMEREYDIIEATEILEESDPSIPHF